MKKTIVIVLIASLILALAGCNQEKQEVNVSVNDIVDNIKEVIKTDLIEGGVSEEDFAEGNLPGYSIENVKDGIAFEGLELDEKWLEEGTIIMPMININSNMIVVLKASDEEYVDELGVVLNALLKKQDDTWGSYLPDQYDKVKNNVMKLEGKYLIYITYDDPDKIENIFDEALNIKESK